MDAWEKRLSDMFGDFIHKKVACDDDLPVVTDETLEIYLDYLKKQLVFPFSANYERESGFLSTKTTVVQVIGINELIDDFYGLICSVKINGKNSSIPMGELEVNSTDSNFNLIGDYNTWFWNYR